MTTSLTDLQLAIMRILWDRAEATVLEVQTQLRPERDLAQTTIATLLSRLEKRGVVEHRLDGRQFVYRPLVTEQEVRRSMVSELTTLLFDGSSAALMSHLLRSREIEAGDLDRVKRMIADAEGAAATTGRHGRESPRRRRAAMRPDVLFTQSVFAESLVARGADVAAAWLLTYLVHSSVILALAWIVTSRPRVTDTVREVIWKFALVGGLVTASIQTAVAREPLGGQFRLAPRTLVATEELRISMRGAPTAEQRRFVVARSRGFRWSAALVVVWLTGSGVGLLWLTFRHARTLRVLSDRTSLDDTSVRSRLDALQRRAGVSTTISLTCSGSIASPLALAGDEVCLPRRALLELTPNEQEGMLAHEVAHLVRRDPQWLIAARAIETVLFMQPLNRLARHRLQEVAEFLCDDWAVSRMSQPVTLAKCLAAVAEWVGRAPRMQVPRLHPMSAMVESAGSPLVRRVARILNGRVAPRAGTSRWTFATSALVLIALAATAPRVSVAHAAATDRIMGFVRAMSTGAGGPGHDSIVVVRATGARFAVDSLVRRRRGAAAGAATGRADIIVVERRP